MRQHSVRRLDTTVLPPTTSTETGKPGAASLTGATGHPTNCVRSDAAARLVAVVVPARDEEASIERCLASIHRAASHPHLGGVHVVPIVVLDGCRDTTGERAADPRHPWSPHLRLVECSYANVGAARRRGLDAALASAAGLPDGQVWLALTDADSAVPHDWLARQLAWRATGAEAVAGTVSVRDWREQSSLVRRRFVRYLGKEGQGFGHPHVHGANLSFSASAYRRAGAVPEVATGEDGALWSRLRTTALTVSTGDLAVETSGRRDGRAPGGFADFLAGLERVPGDD